MSYFLFIEVAQRTQSSVTMELIKNQSGQNIPPDTTD